MLYNIGVICGFKAGTNKAHAINTLNLANGFYKLSSVESVTIFAQSDSPKLACEAWEREFDFVSSLSLRFYRNYDELFELLNRSSCHCYYVRDYRSTEKLCQLKVPYVLETHAHPDNNSFDLLEVINRTHDPSCVALTTISESLREAFILKGAEPSKVYVNPDCVDFEKFAPCRAAIKTRYTIGYAGHLYRYKGIGCVLWAMRLLPKHQLFVAGGSRLQTMQWSLLSWILGVKSRVSFYGWIPHKAIPEVLASIEILLLPPSRNHPSARWTSPVKLGEYLASGAKVVCSDIDALRDWVTTDQVWFFDADNHHSLANVISALDGTVVNDKFTSQLQLAESLDYTVKARWCFNRLAQQMNGPHVSLSVAAPPLN